MNRQSLSPPSTFVKRFAAAVAARWLYQPTGSESDEYHKWFSNTGVWNRTTWMGIACWKSPSDMWNYLQILVELKPSLVIEFGSYRGASAMFYANVMRQIGKPFKVLSVDIRQAAVEGPARADPDILFIESSSPAPAVAEKIRELMSEFPGPTFAILDSDHSMKHVLTEMKLLRPLLRTGDYLVVGDSNINGHPVLPGFGPGPYEAIEAYERESADDYRHDVERENKFGWAQAPYGFLIRN